MHDVLALWDQQQCVGVQQVELRKHLVREKARRHKEKKTGGAIQDEKLVLEAPVAIGEERPIHYLEHGFVELPAFQPSHVEVSDVSSDRTVLHLRHVVNSDDVEDTR